MVKRQTNGKNLVIVESPAKARTIAKYLGSGYIVKPSLGHVRDLPERQFGIDVSNNFAPTYEIVPARAKTVAELKKLAAAADKVYLATDLDREGEAIAWHLVEALKLPPEKVRRVVFNAITKAAITEAFSNPHEIDLDRVNAQQARRILDRIVGYELSPLLWQKIARGLSAGRVQSVAVRLIVEREREIRAFVPEESWKLLAYLAADPSAAEALRAAWQEYLASGERTQKDAQLWLSHHGGLRVELDELGGQPFAARTVEEACRAVQALGFRVDAVQREVWKEYVYLGLQQVAVRGTLDLDRLPAFRVAQLHTRRTVSKPPAPFTTATMQQQASTVLRFSASRTMRTAQSLYEGVDINGQGPVGLITYMRTDSTNIAPEAITAVRDFIRQRFGDAYLPERPHIFAKRQERAQEAHEAIRPTDPTITPEDVRGALTSDQYRLYDLIWKRFVASQMAPAQWDSTTITVTAETALGVARFSGSGRKLAFDGYLKVAGTPGEDPLLPELSEGQPLGLLGLEPRQQYTSPPPRYTEASLVKALEAEGIGRPSTYATIIDTIQERGYVEQVDRKFYPTALGELVTDKLVQHFPKIMDVKFTSHMEDELDKIEEAHLDWVQVLHEFYDPFRELLARAKEEMATARSQPSSHACPACGAPMVYRWARSGRFLACSKYPRCSATLVVDRDGQPVHPPAEFQTCKECGRPMLVRQSGRGFFLGCSGYPACRCTIPCNAQGQPLRTVREEELRRPCDVCGTGQLVVKRKGGRAFLGCNRYPECTNTAPLPADVRLERPPAAPKQEAGINCEKCGRPMVIRSGKRGRFVACSGYPRCRHTLPLEKLEAGNSQGTVNSVASTGVESPEPESATAAENQAKTTNHVPPGYALTRTGRLVVEVLPESGRLTCPQCGGTVELKRGRYGPFFSCTNFPRCRFNCNVRGAAKKQAEELLPAPARPRAVITDILCDQCGAPMVVRSSLRGRFLGCSAYPKCLATKELPAGFEVPAPAAAPT